MIQSEKTKKYIFINLLKKHLTPPQSGGIIISYITSDDIEEL